MDEAAKSNEISLEEFLEVEVRHLPQMTCRMLLMNFQRHKLGSNLTPVTRETFAVWKKTRMDKKAAEEEAVRKAKNAQNAAGKSVGMSGRDLVNMFLAFLKTRTKHPLSPSSPTILNGLQTRMMMMMMMMTGILISIGARKRLRIWKRRNVELLGFPSKTGLMQEMVMKAVEGSNQTDELFNPVVQQYITNPLSSTRSIIVVIASVVSKIESGGSCWKTSSRLHWHYAILLPNLRKILETL